MPVSLTAPVGPLNPHPSVCCVSAMRVASCLTAGLLLVSAYHGLHRLPALGLGSRQQEILGISPEIHLQVDVEIHGASLGALEHIRRDAHGGFSAPPTTLSGLTSAAQSTTIIRRAVRRILCLHQRNGHTHFAPRVRNNFFFRVPRMPLSCVTAPSGLTPPYWLVSAMPWALTKIELQTGLAPLVASGRWLTAHQHKAQMYRSVVRGFLI